MARYKLSNALRHCDPKEFKSDKELLLRDLCARLLYGIKVLYKNEIFDVEYICPMYEEIKLDNHETWTLGIEEVKPYLRPMSSMTEEEEKEICQFMKDYNLLPGANRAAIFCGEITDWLNTHYFDYRGLIERGLALVAPEGMYNIKEK